MAVSTTPTVEALRLLRAACWGGGPSRARTPSLAWAAKSGRAGAETASRRSPSRIVVVAARRRRGRGTTRPAADGLHVVVDFEFRQAVADGGLRVPVAVPSGEGVNLSSDRSAGGFSQVGGAGRVGGRSMIDMVAPVQGIAAVL